MTEEAPRNVIYTEEAFQKAMARKTARDAEEAKKRGFGQKENRMKEYFKNIVLLTAFFFGLPGIIMGIQIYKNNKAKLESIERAKIESIADEKKEAIRKTVIELADKHNAVTDWNKPLEKKRPYTIEIEDALIRKDSQPVLFFLSIKDIERKGDKYLVQFDANHSYSMIESSKIEEIILDCSDKQVEKIMQQPRYLFYAVIAVINKINKVSFIVRANPEVEWESDFTEDRQNAYPVGKIEIDEPDTVVAAGSCVDLLYIGNYSGYDFYPWRDLSIKK